MQKGREISEYKGNKEEEPREEKEERQKRRTKGLWKDLHVSSLRNEGRKVRTRKGRERRRW